MDEVFQRVASLPSRDPRLEIIDALCAPMYVVDAGFRLAAVSAGAARSVPILGQMRGHDFVDVVCALWAEDFASEVVARFRHTLATGETYRAETTETRATNDVESYVWEVQRVPLADGAFGVLCAFTDQTARVRADRALRESERRWRLIARLGDRTRHLEDPRDVVLSAMELLREHLGADRCAWAEVEADEDHFTFVGVASAPGVATVAGRFPVSAFGRDALRTMRDGLVYVSDDLASQGADRETYEATGIASIIAVPILRGGRFVAGTGVHMLRPRAWSASEVELTRELTERCWESVERARVERALRVSEARHRAVVDAQSEMICRVERSGALTFVNPGFARAAGIPADALVGRDAYEFLVVDDHAAVIAALDALTPASRDVSIEARFHAAAGARWALWSVRALSFDGGRWSEAQATGVDIDERRRMEEALKLADRRKDEFLAMLSHELRNPLAPMRSAVDVLRAIGLDDPRQRRALDATERQLKHLTRLVDDLLDVARITQGKVTLALEPVEVADIVGRAVEAVRSLFDVRRVGLCVSLPREPAWVDGDLTRLVQALGNILHNAAKYTHEGGRVDVEVARAGGDVVVRVRDDGAGIAPEVLPHVFDLFVQSRRTLDRGLGGLGVGLTVVRGLVELHGGRVTARSEGVGRGSEMEVRLPLRATSHAEPPRAAPEVEARAGVRVLVIEDNRDAAEMLGLSLEARGYVVRVASDGLEGVEAALAWRPQVVICDIGLPGLDGYSVVERLRSQAELSRTRWIALSGYGRDEDRARSEAAGFHVHLTKPVAFDRLARVIASLA